MRRLPASTMLLLFLATLPAIAQVHRCKDSSGQLVYSDKPCSAGQSGELIEKRKSQRAIYEEREQAFKAEASKQERYAEERQRERMERAQALEQSQYGAPAQPKGYAERLAERNSGVRSNLEPRPGSQRAYERADHLPAQAPNEKPYGRIKDCFNGICKDNYGNRYIPDGHGNFDDRTNGRRCNAKGICY